MSTIDNLPESPEFTAEDDRKDVLSDLDEAMDEAFRKFTNGRVRNPENEKVRIQWFRAYVYAAATRRQLVSDIEEAEHEDRIEHLEQTLADLTAAKPGADTESSDK
jgi:hypothetical protein